MFDAVVAAALKDVAKTHQVALDVSRWVFDRVAHTRLSRQIYHLVGLMGCKGNLHCNAVFQMGFDQLEDGTCAVGGCLLLL